MPKPALTDAEVTAFVQQAFPGAEPPQQLVEGLESQAFRFRLDEHEYVLRINHSMAGFAKDRYAAELLAPHGVPVPEVVALDWLDPSLAYCVTRLLPGRTLQALPAGELPAVLGPTAEALVAIGTVDVSGSTGYGPFDGTGTGRFPDWRSFLLAAADPTRYQGLAGVDAELVSQCRRQLLELAGNCPETRSLVHGDFGADNVLTDGEQITGVLDWEIGMYGDPWYDIANVLFWGAPGDDSLPCMTAQADYYRQRLPEHAGLRRRLSCYQLRIGLNELRYYARADAPDDLAWVDARCRALLADVSVDA